MPYYSNLRKLAKIIAEESDTRIKIGAPADTNATLPVNSLVQSVLAPLRNIKSTLSSPYAAEFPVLTPQTTKFMVFMRPENIFSSASHYLRNTLSGTFRVANPLLDYARNVKRQIPKPSKPQSPAKPAKPASGP